MNFQCTFRCFESGVSPLRYRKAQKALLSCVFSVSDFSHVICYFAYSKIEVNKFLSGLKDIL